MTEEQFKALIAKGSPDRSNVKSIIKDLVKHANNVLLDFDQTGDNNKEDPKAPAKFVRLIQELQDIADGTKAEFMNNLGRLFN